MVWAFKIRNTLLLLLGILCVFFGIEKWNSPVVLNRNEMYSQAKIRVVQVKKSLYTAPFSKDIPVKKYFKTLDSLVEYYRPQLPFAWNEFILIQANPRIIDSLQSFDYYRKKEKGVFIYDQKELIIFHKGDQLLIPDSEMRIHIQKNLDANILDLNIPEYRLRIIRNTDTLFSFPVRVGRNERKYLELAKHVVSLRTPQGEGTIIRIERNPIFINPVTGKTYYASKRDDDRYTRLPLIPWIEPELNGLRQGAMIHPTTNQQTLNKAYSNGCVGLNEADMWRVYYEAPLGTRVIFRYEPHLVLHNGEILSLKDIYNLRK